MAFTPIIKEKEINGQVFKAQFNGFSSLLEAQSRIEGNAAKTAEYVFKHIIVEPKISDVDSFFGTNAKLFSEVLTFGSKVMGADPEYFPEANEGEAKRTSKK